MNNEFNQIIYRGFTPKVLPTNLSFKKPEVIYRGFRVREIVGPILLTNDIERIYRGVRMNEYRNQSSSEQMIFQYAS